MDVSAILVRCQRSLVRIVRSTQCLTGRKAGVYWTSMSLKRQKGGTSLENSEYEATQDSHMPVSGLDDNDLDSFLNGLGSADMISITRNSPIDRQGYIGSIAWDPGLDVEEEIKRAYGPGTYLIRVKSQTRNGRITFRKGSRVVKIGGEPTTALALQNPGYPPNDMQQRLLDFLAKSEGGKTSTVETVKQIMEILNPTLRQDPNSLQGLMQAAEAGKKLAKMFGGEAPVDDDDDDDEDEEDPQEKMMGKLIEAAMMKFLSPQGHAVQPYPTTFTGHAEGMDTRLRPPGPAPAGFRWVNDRHYGFVLVQQQQGQHVQTQNRNSTIDPGQRRTPDSRSVNASTSHLQQNGSGPRQAPTPAAQLGREPLNVQSVPSGDKLPLSHQEGGVNRDVEHFENGSDTNEKKKLSTESRVEVCPRCKGTGMMPSITPEDDTVIKCSMCKGLGRVRIRTDSPFPPRSEWEADRGDESKKSGYDMIVTKEDVEERQMNIEPYTDLGTDEPQCNACGSKKFFEQFGVIACVECGNPRGTNPTIVKPDELIGVSPVPTNRYFNEDGEDMQCDDADCNGWLMAVDGADALECSVCKRLHDLDGCIIDEEEEVTPESWAEQFSSMPENEKRAAIRALGKTLGIGEEMAEALYDSRSENG